MSEQADLGTFGAGEDRPAEEAAAVADEDETATTVVDADSLRFPDAEGTVDLSVTQVDYTVEGRGDDEFPVVHVFGRRAVPDGDPELEHVEVYDFEPYFYAPIDEVDDERIAQHDGLVDYRETDDEGDPFKSIRGDRLAKIIGRTPRDVGQVRDEFDHYEADILFPNRFLIDKDVTSGIRVPERRTDGGRIRVPHQEVQAVDRSVRARLNVFDIEVDDRRGFPEDGEEPIVCLTSYDSYDDQYVNWLYQSPAGVDGPEALAGYEPIEDDFEADVRVFDEEEEMLEAFVNYLRATDPDYLSGWNFADFDAPYLLDRLEALQSPTHDYDLDIDRLSRVDEVWRSDWNGPDIKGRVVFDLLRAYKATKFTELESYRLDAVGEAELGVGKERYPGDIGDLWEQDPERLLEYNLRDVELCVELDRKQDIVAFFEEVASFVGCKLEDAPTAGDAVDMYVLHKAHGEFALPSKGTVESGEEFEGGAVFEPITGVRETVSVLDLKCFSGDTDVLTPDGAKNIREVEAGDPIYTLNPETFECEIKPVAETHAYKNRYGQLHHISGDTHDFKVTENHRFLVSTERGWDEQSPGDFEFTEYRDLTETRRYAFPRHEPMDGTVPERFDLVDEVDEGYVVVYSDEDVRWFRNRMPEAVVESLDLAHGPSGAVGLEQKVGKYLLPVSVYRSHRQTVEEYADRTYLKYDRRHRETPISFEMEDWLAFLGWYITGGSIDDATKRTTIHQQGQTDRDTICSLLDRMGINYSTDQRGINISNQYLQTWLRENCGNGSSTKRLPEWVFGLDGELLETLLETMVRGDGTWTESGLGKLWTTSDDLKDAVVDVAVRCGEKPTVSRENDGTWYVSIGKRGSFKQETHATVEPHDGDVYCVTAEDNHVVLAGRNGHFQWVGQSLYPMCMWTTNASPETKVDPETYDGDTYRTPTGQHFRTEPAGMMREMIDELLTERDEKKKLRDSHDPGTEAYEVYDRQQASVKVIMNCFTPDTEVLTPDGVRGIRDLSVGDDVYSLDPETMEMEVKPVVETQSYPEYEGELVEMETDKIDFRVTPNHRMLVRKDERNGISWDEDDYRFVEAGDLDRATNYRLPHDWDGPDGEHIESVDLTELLDDYELWVRPDVHGHTFAAEVGYYPDKVLKNDIGTEGYVFDADEFERHREYIDEVADRCFVHAGANREWIPRTYDGDDFLELLAWYITEGNVYTSEEKQFGEKLRGSATTVQIARDAPAMADGGDQRDSQSDHAAIGDLLGRFLERTCGEDSFHKRIPDLVFEAATEQKRRFLEILIDGDGDRQQNSWRYSTASDQLRDDVLRLCAHLGLTANYREDSGTWRIYVSEGSKNTLRMHRSGSRTTADEGVYCVTVANNHTLLAGRNGKFQFVGQSLYGVSGWDRFRLYDKDSAAAVTATGREVISYTQETVNEFGYEVIYGDTDSVMISLDTDMSTDEVIDASFELEEQINDSYDEFAREQLLADEHRFEIEFEKLYRRF
ncbi:DNA polymerase, partial [Halobacteriales archaeon QH_10_67_22]